ncbi:MAG: PDZ domain-containing protein [candidate division WOR-3 bacterium]
MNRVVIVSLITFLAIGILNAQSCPGCPGQGTCPEKEERIIEKKVFIAPEAIERGFLGVITEEAENGLEITEVVPESPAEFAGLKPGDIILEINGEKLLLPEELRKFMQQTRPGDEIELKVLRKEGGEDIIKVKLAPVPKSPSKKLRKEVKFEIQGGGAGYFGPGLGLINYSALNNLFNRNFLPALKRNHFVFGGGGYGQVGRVRIGGYGAGGVQSISNNQLDVEAQLGFGFFELGYCIIYTKRLLVTPLLGIGGGGITLKITPLYNRPSTLDDILGTYSTFGSSKVSKGGMILYPGLGIDIPLKFSGLSLKTGYLYSALSSSWEHEDYGRINGPDFTLKGLYVSLNILFGGFDRPSRR